MLPYSVREGPRKAAAAKLASCKALAQTLVVGTRPSSSSGYLLVLTSDIFRRRPYASCVPRSRHEDVLEDARHLGCAEINQ